MSKLNMDLWAWLVMSYEEKEEKKLLLILLIPFLFGMLAWLTAQETMMAGVPNRTCANYWRHFLETGPDPIAMVIRVELFTLKPSVTIQICTAWLLMHDYVTGGFCLAGLVDKSLDSNYHGNWVWAGFEIVPPGVTVCRAETKLINKQRSIKTLMHKRTNMKTHTYRHMHSHTYTPTYTAIRAHTCTYTSAAWLEPTASVYARITNLGVENEVIIAV